MSAVLHVRALLALLFAAARYVPLPILDDVVRERIARMVVARAAQARGTALDPKELAALGASSEGCFGCLVLAIVIPVRFLLIFVLPFVAVVFGVRWASRDLVEIFALGRTVERVIDDARYPRDAPIETRLAYARDVRRAFDLARRGLDLHSVQGLLSVALGPIRAIASAAMRAVHRAWHGETSPSPGVEAPASRLEAALDDPRMRSLLETIDRRFDEQLLALRARGRGA